MKLIISHDIDHLSAWEHRSDLIMPKVIMRALVEYFLGFISVREVTGRIKNIMSNKWQNLDEIMEFNKSNEVPATFFIGVANGKGLNYTRSQAEKWVNRIIEMGFDIGVHGIAYDDLSSMKKEHSRFMELSGIKDFGIRMHYLSNHESTADYLSEAGYLFDCSVLEMENPYKVNDMWEFPLQVMDTHIVEKDSRWQSMTISQAQDKMKVMMSQAFDKGLSYFSVLFHDIYFSDCFRTWKEWYIWLVQYAKDNDIGFINYRDAIIELEGGKN